MSEDDVAGVGNYEGAAAGWDALKAVADTVRGQKAVAKECIPEWKRIRVRRILKLSRSR